MVRLGGRRGSAASRPPTRRGHDHLRPERGVLRAVVGGIAAGDEYAFVTHTVVIDKAGDYFLHVSGDADMLATFGSCDDCLSSGRDILLFARGSQRTTLAEGAQFVQLAGPAASAGQISLSLERLGAPSA